VFRQKEEARKATEHLFTQQEEPHKAREDLFNEWEFIQYNVRELSRDLANETNEIIKGDMETDIVVLLIKNQFADRLSFN